ncbi:hypothetical protein ACFO3O_05040 [Dokdonia ponticola]|uniref:Uncharacterized protein n=1 Tax=Dokdonia ponticola TaxID=2041041 RepID=A0ABV9HW48_9FLAO
MLKTILNVKGVQELSRSQQKNTRGGLLDPSGNNSCGSSEVCPDGSNAVWSNECEGGCEYGTCDSGFHIYRPCETTGTEF